MLLEKLKEHGGKIMFFIMNVSVVTTGVFFIKQKNVEKTNSAIAETDVQNYKSAADYALEIQRLIRADGGQKTDSIANNSDTVQKQQSVPVTKTIPAVTKTVTVQQPASSSSSSSAKTTTKKS